MRAVRASGESTGTSPGEALVKGTAWPLRAEKPDVPFLNGGKETALRSPVEHVSRLGVLLPTRRLAKGGTLVEVRFPFAED